MRVGMEKAEKEEGVHSTGEVEMKVVNIIIHSRLEKWIRGGIPRRLQTPKANSGFQYFNDPTRLKLEVYSF